MGRHQNEVRTFWLGDPIPVSNGNGVPPARRPHACSSPGLAFRHRPDRARSGARSRNLRLQPLARSRRRRARRNKVPPPRKPADRELHGLGSGVYIGDGLVVTNNHVVEVQDPGSSKFRPMDEIKVITDHDAPDGSREYPAKVLGNDPQTNVALLRIAAPTLPMLTSCRRMLRSTQATRVGRSSI